MIASATDPRSTGPARRATHLPDHISPSAAKSYLGYSLQFYFERVARIRKNTPVALHLGKAVHGAQIHVPVTTTGCRRRFRSGRSFWRMRSQSAPPFASSTALARSRQPIRPATSACSCRGAALRKTRRKLHMEIPRSRASRRESR